MNKLDIAKTVAWSHINTMYRWGGDDPSGFDCSGFVIEILKSVGLLPLNGDYTAQGLFNKFKGNTTDSIYPGCLVFWGNKNRITHVEFCIDDGVTIGASGGGSKTNTEQDAINQNAYVKVRPIRSGWVKVVDPFK